MDKKRIYLDHGASTPVQPQVIEAMLPYWTEVYGNPSSSHDYGRQAGSALDQSRRTIAELLHAHPDEITFTGCGSESDNMALRGVMYAARANGTGNHMITCIIEHGAVLKTAEQLRDHFDFDVTILPVDQFGQVNPADVEAAIRPDTALISIMAANNEIGTLQPVLMIGRIAREHGIPFHTDAIQAVALMLWDMAQMPIDLMSIAPHKFYGPKGVGVLYARRGVELVASLTGGGQEDGRRSGTVNVPFAVGAAKAFELAMVELEERNNHYQTLRDHLIDGILAAFPGDCLLTGHPTERLPHNASFAFRNVDGNNLLMHLDMVGVAASSGSACKTGNPKPSAILEAIGLDAAWTKGGLRLTVGKQNSLDDIEYVVGIMPGIIEKLQKLNLLFA
jgi:cysteine desulfurase